MAELRGIEYLRQKLELKRPRCLTRYKYYDQKNDDIKQSQIVPPQLQWLYRSVMGWCTQAVDSIADRLVFTKFLDDNFNMQTIFEQNNMDILFDSAIRGALITSCDFIYISADEKGFPRMQVIDGSNATGIIDPITHLLIEGYAVLERDDNDNPITELYFKPYSTTVIKQGDHKVFVEEYGNNVPYALLVPIIFKPDSNRYFGHSRISRACIDIVDKARNTITRSEVSAEFYAFPQKYVTNLSQDAEPLDKWRATMSAMLQFTKDDEGDHPILGQFQQQSMTPFIEQLKMYASIFAGETGLTLDDLGFISGNPMSYEAIKSSHEKLRSTARSAQRSFATGFINAGYLASCLRDDKPYERNEIYQTKVLWQPLFETDFSALSSAGDGIIKINQALPEYFDKDKIDKLIGS